MENRNEISTLIFSRKKLNMTNLSSAESALRVLKLLELTMCKVICGQYATDMAQISNPISTIAIGWYILYYHTFSRKYVHFAYVILTWLSKHISLLWRAKGVIDHVGDTAFLLGQKTHITRSRGWHCFFAQAKIPYQYSQSLQYQIGNLVRKKNVW